MEKNFRAIALYLPQYHPIPENDQWWGKGFTEWTNVSKAKPLFKGHKQPHLPGELGFYDLRVPEVREAQAELAKNHGIEGFCYWHYWFGNRKRLLERPFNEVLSSGKPDFPFCLGWANASWTGIWQAAPDRVLIEQTYPGENDYIDHFNSLLPAFMDKRYLSINGDRLFVVYQPEKLPDPIAFTQLWRKLAEKNGFGFHFIGVADGSWNPKKYGFDCFVGNSPFGRLNKNKAQLYFRKFFQLLTQGNILNTYSYRELVDLLNKDKLSNNEYPVIIPNWDNSPRCGKKGIIFNDSTPELFKQMTLNAIGKIQYRPYEQRIIFIKSWNEWAEGNYLEPDQWFGDKYLNVIKSLVFS